MGSYHCNLSGISIVVVVVDDDDDHGGDSADDYDDVYFT